MKCLVIIPAYNEEENIVRVVENLKNNYPMYDYVVINDGSSDDTARLCRRKGYELVDLPVNLGLAGAFQTGLKYAWRDVYKRQAPWCSFPWRQHCPCAGCGRLHSGAQTPS